MSLAEIIGQEKAIEILTGILKRRRLAGSYIFSGEPGIGKKLTAVNFAKALNCLKDTDFDACDECESCLKIKSGNHPDLLLVSPQDRLIKIDEIRLINDALSFRPFEGRKKVVIVNDADAMNIAAANAFLKTLEEPPKDSVIILISSRPDRLPATIRSRCSRVNFVTLSLEACKQVLRGRVPDEALEALARLSMGRPGLALSSDLKEEITWFGDLLKGMLNAEKDSWASREDMDKWFEYVLTMLRDAAVFRITGEASQMINADLGADLGEYACKLGKSNDLKVIINIYKELAFVKGLLMFNLNKSITWNYTASLLRKGLVV
ncbi:MAG: DNA polymerase III subunit delta' [Nitrospira bacterium HGW-Nitrospira-1]|nr:MAG: DNA polymerase III subunit delta' [Nitrospira bacterium HGW-Nitrospira-1]